MTFLVIGLLSLTTTSLAVHALRKVDGERHLANRALKRAAEDIQSYSNAQLGAVGGWSLAMVNAYAPGGAIGDTFDIQGLTPWEGEASCGSIQVVTDETARDADLEVLLGMPRDLDSDGLTDNTDVSGTAGLLPVVIRIRWQGVSGQREVRQGLYVSGL